MIKQIIWFSFFNFLYVSANYKIPLLGRLTGSSDSPLSVPLQNHRNMHYYGDVALGTPPKKFSMLFDSGYTDIIVLVRGHKRICNIPQIKEKCLTNKHAEFDPYASSTYKKIEGTFAAEFVDQSKIRGYLATDVLEIGEENSKIRVKVPVGVADVLANSAAEYDGIFGLAFNMGSSFDPRIITPFECMVSQADLPPRFSFYAKREEKEGEDISGELCLGGYNPAYMVSNFLVSVTVNKIDYLYFGWRFNLDGIKVGDDFIQLEGKDIDGDGIPGTIAIPDTGSSSIGAPPPLINLLLRYIFSKGIPQDVYSQSMFLCASLPDNLPEIAFVVNGKPLTLGPEDYITTKMDGVLCESRLKALGNSNKVILGYTFLQKYYTMFDYEKKEIKFAVAKQPVRKPEDRQPGKTGREKLKRLPPNKVEEIREQAKTGYVSVSVPASTEDPLAQLQSVINGQMKIMGQEGYGPQRQPSRLF